jgi:uncharacterized membrane protein YGL010W
MFEVYNVAIIPLLIGLIELFKLAGLPVKYAPFVSVVLGLLFGIFYLTSDLKEGIVIGLMVGLSATGLYSGTKNIIKSNSNDK